MTRASDDFADGLVNQRSWYSLVTGTGTVIAERNGRLEISISPDAVAGGQFNLISGQLGMTCRFPDDFDARVEFELLRWPPANGVSIELDAFHYDGSAHVARASRRDGETYAAWFPRANVSEPGVHTRGKLRLRRSGAFLAAYFWDGGRWVVIYQARLGTPVSLALQAVSDDASFADAEVQVAFDNFVVDARSPVC